jgi:hypothetical protein
MKTNGVSDVPGITIRYDNYHPIGYRNAPWLGLALGVRVAFDPGRLRALGSVGLNQRTDWGKPGGQAQEATRSAR